MSRKLIKPNQSMWTQRILVFYINVGNRSPQGVANYIAEIKQRLTVDKPADAAPWYFIPIRDSETHIECINPILVGDNTELAESTLNKISQLYETMQTERLIIDKPDKFYINKLEV